jgi:regulator of CtrA degradation
MKQPQKAHQPQEVNVLFLPSVFNETLNLLFDAHHYFQHDGVDEQSSLPQPYRLVYAHEMSKVTMRLTSIMAWVMVRKAVYAGRINDDIASTKYRLDGADICLNQTPASFEEIPFYMNELSKKSLALYQRVHRLDEEVYGTRH